MQNCYFTSHFYYVMMILVKKLTHDLFERKKKEVQYGRQQNVS